MKADWVLRPTDAGKAGPVPGAGEKKSIFESVGPREANSELEDFLTLSKK